LGFHKTRDYLDWLRTYYFRTKDSATQLAKNKVAEDIFRVYSHV